jgi:multiple sugar transport system permease protein
VTARRFAALVAALWTLAAGVFLAWRFSRDAAVESRAWVQAAEAAARTVRVALRAGADPVEAARRAAEAVAAPVRVTDLTALGSAAATRMRAEATGRDGDAVLVPLKDAEDWDVVGAVAVGRPAGLARASPWRPAVAWPLALLTAAAWLLVRWGARLAARRRRDLVTAWSFLGLPVLHLAVFSFVPVAFTVYLSFHRWDLVSPARPFVGLANYRELAADGLFWTTLRNTAFYALYVPVTMVLALAVALLLNRGRRGQRLLRAIVFLPYVSSVVAVGLVWQWMFNADFGLLNAGLRALGLGTVDWLGDPRTALAAIIIVTVWTQVGYQMLVFLAGLQGIPASYLDAATVDGASAWQRFRHVTLPLLRPVILFVLVTGIIAGFQVFTLVYLMTEGGPLHSTDVVVYRIYQTAWEFLRFGYASAMAVVLFLLLLGATLLQFRLLGRRVEHG